MDPDRIEDSVYLNLATSFINAADSSADHLNSTNNEQQSGVMDEFDESDDEPLIHKQANTFNTSDDEPLMKKLAVPSDFNTSDEEPLILKQVPDVADDSADPTFLPSEESETSRHDSESDTVDSIFPGKEVRGKKRHLKTKRQSDQLRAQKAVSLALTKKREESIAEHQARLDNLLSANGLIRTEIYPDGNCFFEASASHLEETSGEELRRCLCEHLEDNFGAYVPFMAPVEGEDENDIFLRFLMDVSELRKPGKWSNDAADLLPRVLADWSERPVLIYTSDVFKSVIDITPSTSSNIATTGKRAEPITLAFTVHEPSHYDACHQQARKQIPGPQRDVYITSDDEAEDFQPPHQSTPSKDQNLTDGGDSGEGPSFLILDDSVKTTPMKEQPKDINITPRKQGSFQTPPKKNLSRKKKANPDEWKQNVRKSLHLQGKKYTSQTGKTVHAKCVQQIDCSKCRYDCNNRFSKEYRQDCFQTFYALDSYERQKDFVCAHVRDRDTVSILGADNKPLPKKRQRCRNYFFTVDGKEQRICKKFFLATLALGEAYVDHALKNSTNGTFTGKERRGSGTPHNKYSGEDIEKIRKHIEAFPAVESHYTRKDSQRRYLQPGLTVKKMHDLYVQQCQEEGRQPVSTKKYRQIFNSEYNLSFHVPKKDQCSLCAAFAMKKVRELATDDDKKTFEAHQERKKRARLEKDKDKAEAKKDHRKRVVTVDLQAVLQSPCGLVSQLYYRRKLSVYNFTIYSLADGEANCYTWDESEGKRGACEIATCIFFYLSSLPDRIEEVTIFSDCCAGQNRNQYLAAGLSYAAKTIPNIKVITHKYLESGHTQMECDSMHAAITFAKRSTPIYTPSGWDIILRMARRTRPYLVVPIKYMDILDFKALAASILRNTKTDISGQKVNWLQIRELRFEKGKEEEMMFKTSFDQESYQTIKVVGGSKRGRAVPVKAIPHLYSQKLPISHAKKADLLYLCTSGIIPTEHHAFYKSLPASSAALDRLPQPDVNEPDTDSD